ncbi:tyrosine-type recombinase/integrase [Nocardioides sp. NPDC087217]|uniref:tyrosine-type recombinase/integrase n=1 Tax=Nocardioides sp. NPDC087217 TaxID=3364335 RepID=UPI0037F16525
MSVQRYTTADGKVRYRARVKHHGREVANRVFDRKRDAEAWEEEQKRKLRLGEWHDPRRGRVALSVIAADWLDARQTLKRKSQALELMVWKRHIEPKFGKVPVAAITKSDVAMWDGRLVADGRSPSSAARYLGVFRRLLAFAVEDGRMTVNVAATVKPPTAGHVKREGQFLSRKEIHDLEAACAGRYAEIVRVLALSGLRWSELAGLRVGDRVRVPGQGLRLQRTVMASSDKGVLFVDTLKNKRSRTVPLVDELVPIIDKWSEGKKGDDWLFDAPKGGPLSEANWKRSVDWAEAIKKIGRPALRVHDLRHTCASLWLGAGADPKVLQRNLGHASAAMTMDLYGHLIDDNLWDSAKRLGGILAASEADEEPGEDEDDDETGS